MLFLCSRENVLSIVDCFVLQVSALMVPTHVVEVTYLISVVKSIHRIKYLLTLLCLKNLKYVFHIGPLFIIQSIVHRLSAIKQITNEDVTFFQPNLFKVSEKLSKRLLAEEQVPGHSTPPCLVPIVGVLLKLCK